jgi:16S rRNA (adenine1518-N6/adenine1519-N6)-dimethyltransferase
MDLTSAKVIKELLAKHQSRPSKIMGQNFLIDKPTLKKIIETADIQPQDTILEIGPGIGNLTQELAKKAKKVVAIEKDRVMVEILKETLHDFSNIEIVQGNALLATNSSLPTHYKVVANIPYYLTSPIIRMFLEAENQPDNMMLMVQKEVAQRICAKPPHMSILALSVQFYANAHIVSYVSKKCFWPSPNVDSAIINITPNNNNSAVNSDAFFKVIKAGFVQPRKQLINNLSKRFKKNRECITAWLLGSNINPVQRAETLSMKDWVSLTETLDVIK